MIGAIAKTARGERPLGVTYWLWYIVPGIPIVIIDAVSIALSEEYPEIIYWNAFAFWAAFILLLTAKAFLVYLIGYGVILSARKRKPTGFWGWIAIIIVVINMIRLPVSYYTSLMTAFEPPDPSDAQSVRVYQEQMLRQARAQTSLPKQIDSVTTLEGFTFDGLTFVYQYALDEEFGDRLDIERLKTHRLPELCKTFASMQTDGVLERVRYEYSLHGETVSMTIDQSDCDGK
ncbi:hypothetical protein [Amorphus orientalis]|uniref:Uncharacterized protein n=1 Tax=Amorphus orientalis TaxID=649198 RepID=A0AAE3VQE9_9HYPH|nr:hypothetical protein [Amorphus orientalis]MDQ0316414.1 hypothetical protein [Amorphus orientalis]